MTTEQLKNLLNFSVNATQEVEQDFMTVTFQANESGSDPNKVQLKLSERLMAAIEIARASKVPGQVDVQSGNFQIGPTYDKKGAINGYYGGVQLIIYGTDTNTISKLTGEITSMNIADVEHGVSPALRKSVEESLGLKAIQMWRDKATSFAYAFGATNHEIVNVTVQVNSGYNRYRSGGGVRLMAAGAHSEAAGGSYEQEAGKEELTAVVTGSVQLVK